MKINPAPLHLAQTIIIGLCTAFSIAILGCAAHTLDVFNKQQSTNPWWLPLWPQHFTTTGTKAIIGSAVSVFVLSTVFLVFALVPQFNLANRPTLRALLAIGTTLPSSLVTLVTVIYAHILNHDSPELDTIQTWTCKYKNSHSMEQDASMPANMGNGNFGSLCHQSKFALYGTLVVLVLLVGSFGITTLTWLADKWAARQTRKEVEMTAQ